MTCEYSTVKRKSLHPFISWQDQDLQCSILEISAEVLILFGRLCYAWKGNSRVPNINNKHHQIQEDIIWNKNLPNQQSTKFVDQNKNCIGSRSDSFQGGAYNLQSISATREKRVCFTRLHICINKSRYCIECLTMCYIYCVKWSHWVILDFLVNPSFSKACLIIFVNTSSDVSEQ